MEAEPSPTALPARVYGQALATAEVPEIRDIRGPREPIEIHRLVGPR